jgi:hypothetical protein
MPLRRRSLKLSHEGVHGHSVWGFRRFIRWRVGPDRFPVEAYEKSFHRPDLLAKILRGELPCYKVYEDDKALAFLDIMPRAPGHALVLPKAPARNILDVAMDANGEMFTYDNTDDGLGWWTRVTHHVDGGYYGYPFDYHNRPDRHLPRMAEYGGC